MNSQTTLIASALSLAATVSVAHAALVITGSPVTLDFNNLNTNFGGAYDSTGGTSTFPTVDGATGALTTIYSGAGGIEFTVSDDDFNPGTVYSNTGTYSNSNSFRALRDGATSELALGVKDSSDRSFTLILQNNTGLTVTTWDVAYAIEQYSKGASATVFSFDYSLDGLLFVTTNLTGAANVVANNTTPIDVNLASVISTSRSGSISEEVAQGGSIYLRWRYDHQSGTSNHMGVDDITVSVVTVPEPASALLGALGCLAILRRRR